MSPTWGGMIVWWGIARYIFALFSLFKCASHGSHRLPITDFTISTSGPDAWAWLLRMKHFNHSPLTTHFVSCTFSPLFFSDFFRDTGTTTDRGELWLRAIWYSTVYRVYKYVFIHIILCFQDLNLKSDDERWWWMMMMMMMMMTWQDEFVDFLVFVVLLAELLCYAPELGKWKRNYDLH